MTKVDAEQWTEKTLELTSRLLTQNPEYYTIWNHRRRILQQLCLTDTSQVLQRVREDLDFLLPLLTQFPKCYWIWNHRSWLHHQATDYLNTSTALLIWQEELKLVGALLNRDSRNFHGWGYRRTITREIEKLRTEAHASQETEAVESTGLETGSIFESEFAYTTKMIKSNLSNFSAWHYRSRLISKLLDVRGADPTTRGNLFDSELAFIKDALFTDPYDQSLWYYHEYLIFVLMTSNRGSHTAGSDDTAYCGAGSYDWVAFTNHDREEYLGREVKDISELLEDTDDCKWIYQHLLLYTREYMKVEGGNKIVTTQQMRLWLGRLIQLDPLRTRRWEDFESTLDL